MQHFLKAKTATARNKGGRGKFFTSGPWALPHHACQRRIHPNQRKPRRCRAQGSEQGLHLRTARTGLRHGLQGLHES
jgi:hypothetical protein